MALVNELRKIAYDLVDALDTDNDDVTAVVLERLVGWVERDRGRPFPDIRPAPAKTAA